LLQNPKTPKPQSNKIKIIRRKIIKLIFCLL